MRFFGLLALLGSTGGALGSSASQQRKPRDYDNRDYVVVHARTDADLQHALGNGGGELEQEMPLDRHYLLSYPKHSLHKRDFGRSRTFPQTPRQRVKRQLDEPCDLSACGLRRQADTGLQRRQNADPELQAEFEQLKTDLNLGDPMLHEQWHLFNREFRGHDINVTGVWRQGLFGKNVTVSLIDDGIDMNSRDLAENYYAEGSWDFNDDNPVPSPKLFDDYHGTRCAGEIAAVRNDVCGVGIAPSARVSGLRILSARITDADESLALNYDFHNNHIYSCSWGPPDDGQAMEGPDLLIERAVVNGIIKGRHGKGSIFVFASGNGAMHEDNCNFDGYTNSIFSITIGAIDRMDFHPYYSELCAPQLAVTYSSGSGEFIHTTDVGEDKCTNRHGGTSAAAPLAAGIFALVLGVRPDLTWRDLQYLCVETALPFQPEDDDWQDTPAGHRFNHKFGYGKLDAYAIVERAKTWDLIKPQTWLVSPLVNVTESIGHYDGPHQINSVLEITPQMVDAANFDRLEHITVIVNIEHRRRGQVTIDLISPAGIHSSLATKRSLDVSDQGFQNWTLMTVKHWGEDPVGVWTLSVTDVEKNDSFEGRFLDWRMTMWGEAKDASKAVTLPMPGDEDDEEGNGDVPVVSTPVDTYPIQVEQPTVPTPSGPVDVPQRPTKPTSDSESSLWRSRRAMFAYAAGALAVVGAVLGLILYRIVVRRRLGRAGGEEYEFKPIGGVQQAGIGSGSASTTLTSSSGSGSRSNRQDQSVTDDVYDAFAVVDSDDSTDDEDDYAGNRSRESARLVR